MHSQRQTKDSLTFSRTITLLFSSYAQYVSELSQHLKRAVSNVLLGLARGIVEVFLFLLGTMALILAVGVALTVLIFKIFQAVISTRKR